MSPEKNGRLSENAVPDFGAKVRVTTAVLMAVTLSHPKELDHAPDSAQGMGRTAMVVSHLSASMSPVVFREADVDVDLGVPCWRLLLTKTGTDPCRPRNANTCASVFASGWKTAANSSSKGTTKMATRASARESAKTCLAEWGNAAAGVAAAIRKNNRWSRERAL